MAIFGFSKKKETRIIIEKVYLNGKWISRNDENIMDIKGFIQQFMGYWVVTVIYKDGTKQRFEPSLSNVIYRTIEI